MIILRVQRSHYGPEAQVTPQCNQLLIKIEELKNNDPYACQDLI
ncbi:MAG: hypothetical protein Q7U04_13130 [Bacteriovorax sp.]|nr:hypothetical protein [Bacteriovorax sp.]